MLWLTLLVTVLFLFYYWGKKHYSYWKDKEVPGPKPYPIVGNFGPNLLRKISVGELYADIYRKYEGFSFVGIYRGVVPCLLIREPKLIKCIMLKDFKHFYDNEPIVDPNVDNIMGRNPFVLKGEEWRQKRIALTSCFTSSKVKGMFPLLHQISEEMVYYVNRNSSSSLESHEICIRFTLNNVAACAFGLEGRCFQEKDAYFRQLAEEFFSPGNWNTTKLFLLFLFPALTKIFAMRLLNEKVEKKLINIVDTTLKQRSENNIVRNDFLEYVTELQKTSPLFPDKIDIVAQAATFFIDGYETSSRAMSFILYEIAKNQNVQDKLRNEINEVCKKYDNKLTYEGIQEMTYLDACFRETLRLYPIFPQLTKVCTERYTYVPEDDNYKKISIVIEPGTIILISLLGLHFDEKYFKDPNKFIPERFLDKENLNKYVYLPWGKGPRVCLGIRFGMTQIKTGVAQLVKNFKMTYNKKTIEPLQYDPYHIMLAPKGGLWIDFQKIDKLNAK